MDILSQILQAIGYIILLVILVLLWRKALRSSEIRPFWRWLAMAWTMNMLGSLAWIVHDVVTGTELDTLSVIDVFYVSHYVLVGCALWIYPAPLSRRAGLWVGGTMLVTSVVVWTVYFNPAMALRGGDWTGFLGLAMYPVLDAGMITLAWLRVRAARHSAWSMYALLLFCAMVSYGIANTINLTEYVFSLLSSGILQNVLWMLTDVFVLILALQADPQSEKQRLNGE